MNGCEVQRFEVGNSDMPKKAIKCVLSVKR
jgi:hypothetical protein